jgi:hypothetical protein
MESLGQLESPQFGGEKPRASDIQVLSGPAKASLDLVRNQEHVVLVADAAEAFEVALRSRDVASLAENGLDDDGGSVSRCSLLLEKEFELRSISIYSRSVSTF